MLTDVTDYMIYSTSSSIYSLSLNSETRSVPFAPLTGQRISQGLDYDYANRTLFFSSDEFQSVKRWVIASGEVNDIPLAVPYDTSGLYHLSKHFIITFRISNFQKMFDYITYHVLKTSLTDHKINCCLTVHSANIFGFSELMKYMTVSTTILRSLLIYNGSKGQSYKSSGVSGNLSL